jgi:hypothetical protein
MGKRGTPAARIVAIAAFIAVGAGIGICAARAAGDAPTTRAEAAPSTPTPVLPSNAPIAWDGNPDHYDCSPEGHPDPKHPGQRVSDEGGNEPCVPNAPIPPPVDPLAGAAPDVAHCFGPGWATLPDETEGDRKCNPMRLARRLKEQPKEDRDWKRYNEVAQQPRWIDAPNSKPKEINEYYELPGETGEDACAEVIYSPPAYKTYTVSIVAPDGREHNLEEPTRHLAEAAAATICGNGHRP